APPPKSPICKVFASRPTSTPRIPPSTSLPPATSPPSSPNAASPALRSTNPCAHSLNPRKPPLLPPRASRHTFECATHSTEQFARQPSSLFFSRRLKQSRKQIHRKQPSPNQSVFIPRIHTTSSSAGKPLSSSPAASTMVRF